MKSKIIFTLLLIFVITLFSISAEAAIYRKTDFIDCGSSCLDNIDGIAINRNSMPALGIVSTEPEHAINPSQRFFYLWDSDAACTESVSPIRTYIIPNTNASGGCWVLLGIDLNIVGDLDMNDNALTDVGYIDFNLLNGIAAAVGRLVWNATDGTLNLGLLGGNVNLQIGQELVVRAKNVSGGTMADGTPVRISGASGVNPEIDLSEADVLATAEVLGLTTESIDNNQSGYVTTFGLVRDIDTTGTDEGESWSDGDRLYLSNTAGELTNIVPTSTERTVFVGVILRAHASLGVIWVHPLNVYFLDELSDVDVDSPVNEDLMQYNSGTGLWERSAHTSDGDAHIHTIAGSAHSDTTATGAELNTLTDGSDGSSLHNHTTDNLNDTTATGANLNTLTDTSDASGLHNHTTLEKLTVNVSEVEVVGTLSLWGVSGFVRDGNIVYAVGNHASSLITIDITDKTNPVEICRHTNGDISRPHNIVRKGNYLFTTNVESSDAIGVFKINNQSCPVEKGIFTHSSLGIPYNPAISGNVFAVANRDNDSVVFLDISDPEEIKFLGDIIDATLLDEVAYLYCTPDKYCYANSWGNATDYFVKIDANDPTDPRIVDSVQSANVLDDNGPDQTICDDQGCFFASAEGGGDSLIGHINIRTMTVTDTLANATFFTAPNSMRLAGDYLYVLSEDGYLSMVDVSDRDNLVLDSTLTDLTNLELGHNMDIYGEYIIVTAGRTPSIGSNKFVILKQPGTLKATNAAIGNLQVSDLNIDVNARIGQNLKVTGGADVGGGLSVEQDFSAGRGFTVRKDYGFGTPSQSWAESGNRQLITGFKKFREKFYAPINGFTGGAGLGDMLICCNDTAGAVWTVYDGSQEVLKGINVFNNVLYIGQGRQANDGDIFYCDDPSDGGIAAICDDAGDWSTSFDGSYNINNALMTYKEFFYAGMGSSVNQGDVLICAPATGGVSGSICDDAGDWTISRDASELNNASNVQTLATHNDNLYASLAGSTALLAYCVPSDSGAVKSCEAADWNDGIVAADAPFSGNYDSINALISVDGIFYAGMAVAGDSDIFICTETVCDGNSDWSKIIDGSTDGIINFFIHNGVLLYGDSVGDVYRIDNSTATVVISDPSAYDEVRGGVFNGQLYLGYGFDTNKSDIWVISSHAGEITSITGDTTEGNGVGAIVDYVSLTEQTADISETNLFLPPSDGFFRVSIIAQGGDTLDAGDTLDVDINYTDSQGAVTLANTINACDLELITPCTSTVIIQANTIDPITYVTDYTDDGGDAATYNLFIIVERLD